jgi:rod shape-determining protein MreB
MTSLGTRRSPALIAVLGTVLALALPTGGATHAGTTLRCLGKRATVVGTTGDDRLRGTPRDDVIVGMGGDDRIDGAGGNDRICEAGPGSAVVIGGPGNDRVSASSEGGVTARGGAGDDIVRLGGEGDSFDGPDSFDGGAGDDVLVALGAWSGFSSESGNDTIRTTVPGLVGFGFSRSPRGVRLDLRKGLLTGRGRTTIHLAVPSEVNATGSHFTDVLIGSAGIDAFTGRAGDDVLVGSGGGDELAGGAGRDRISGGPGPDRIKEPQTSDLPAPPGGYGSDVVHAGPGDDTVGFDSDDRVYAGGGDDAFLGQFAPGSRQLVDGGPGVNTFDATVRGPSSKKSWAHVLIDLGRGRVDADAAATWRSTSAPRTRSSTCAGAASCSRAVGRRDRPAHGEVHAVGIEAKRMLGRTPGTIQAIRPLKDGVIADFDVTEQMLRHFIQKVHQNRWAHPRVVVCVPSGVTGVEKRAVEEATPERRRAPGVPDRGADGRRDRRRAAGRRADRQHGRRHRRRHDRGRGDLARRHRRLAVDPRRRRRARRGDHQLRQARVQAADRPADGRGGQARDRLGVPDGGGGAGRDPRPRPGLRPAEDRRPHLRGGPQRSRSRSTQIIDAIKETLDRTPPELAADIMDRGIMLAGGGALLQGLDERLRDETQMPVHLAESPLTCVAVGSRRY